MRHRILASISAVSLALVVAPPAAEAQRAVDTTALERRVEALEQELSVLRERAVQVPALTEAVQELDARLTALERDLELIERHKRSASDVLGRLDNLDQRVRTLAGEAEGVRTQLAQLEQPWVPAGGSGGMVHDHGFQWISADGRHALRIAGYLQARYALEVSASDIERSTLLLRRARFGLSGHVGSEQLSYRLLVSALGEPALLDYFIDYALHENMGVRLGQYKVPFTRSFITSGTRLAFVERPRALDTVRYDRDVQIGFHGELIDDRLGWYAGIGNGAGPNQLDDNQWLAATLRADAVIIGDRFGYSSGDLARIPKPALMIGMGFVHDRRPMPAQIGDAIVENDVDGDGAPDDVLMLSASLDAVFRYLGAEILIEAVWRHEGTDAILDDDRNAALRAVVGDRRTHTGIGGQLTYLLPWDVLVGARVGYARLPVLGVGGRTSTIPRGEHLLELDGVVQLYRDGTRGLGLMYSLQRFDERAGLPGITDHRLLAEAQLAF